MQRPQYLAVELSKHHNVYYIEPTISTMRWILKRGQSLQFQHQRMSNTLHVVKLNGLFAAPWIINPIDFTGVSTAWERRQAKNLMQSIDIAWVGHCGWYPLVQRLKYKCLIYDKMDDNALIARNPLRGRQLAKSDNRLLHISDCIIATAVKLYNEALCVNPKAYLVPNAVSNDFAKVSGYVKPTGKKKIFGYVGMVDTWFDVKAIQTIVESDSNNEVVIVGPNNIPQINHNRIKYLGRVSKDKIPEMIKGFDVCLYPFKKIPLLETINPVKIYEYLALNKPVIAAYSSEIHTFGKLVYPYKSYEQLESLSKKILTHPFPSISEQLKFINENNWEHRGTLVKNIIGDICNGAICTGR